MNKFLIVLILFSTLFGQDADGQFSLGEISFLIKNIHFEGDFKDHDRNTEFNNGIGSLDIGLIKYGFSDIKLSGDLNAYNKRAQVKYKFTGPEFEMSNFKMEVSFDAPNIWLLLKEEMANVHTNYVKDAYASEAKSVISNIENAGKMYYQTYGEWPSDIEEMERRGLLEVDRSTKLKWQFELNMSLDGGTITAESTEEMKGGPGRLVVFYPARGRFLGYGSVGEIEDYGNRERKIVKNNLKFSIGKINQYFGASGSVDLNERNQIVDFQLQKAGFSVSKVNANFTVDMSSKTTFSIADFKTEAKNIALEFDIYDEIPTVEKATFEISLKNLEINVPREVHQEPQFKEIADYLNINSGKFRIRQIDLDLTFNRGRDLKLKGTVDTQFGKAVINGEFSIRQPVRYDSDLTIDKFTVEISNLSKPINNFIEVWEEGTGNTLPRKGKSIYLEISGDLNQPQIKGLDIRF